MAIRERREELSTTIAFSSGNQVLFTGGIPRDRPLSRLFLALEGRMTISGQSIAGNIFPEAPATLIRNVQLRGTKVTGGGTVTLVNARGEELHRLSSFYEAAPAVGVEVAGLPSATGVAFPAPLTPTNNGSFDFRCYYVLPIAPRFATIQDEIAGVTDPSIYSQLDLLVTFGTGQANFVSGGTLTFALSAFGSASGNPAVRVVRFSPLLGKSKLYNKWHYTLLSKQINMNSIAAAATDTKIADLNIGNWLRFAQLRQYSENTSVSGQIDQSGGSSLARIGDNSNPGIFRIRVKLNGTEIFRMINPDLQEHNRQQYDRSTLIPQGYSVIDFTERGFMGTAFDSRGFGAAAARFELFGDWTGITSTDKLDILQTERIPVKV